MSAPWPVRAADDTRADWETPAELFDQLLVEFPFCLDAAATEANRKTRHHLSGPCVAGSGVRCDCGLCSPWGCTTWCNPPFGKGLDKWVAKFAAERATTLGIVALLPANTDTEWFRTVWNTATEIRFLHKRVQFVGSTSSNPSGSIVAIYRPDGMPTGMPHVRLWDWRK